MRLPPEVRDWLAEGHLAHQISDLVDGLDQTVFYAPYAADGRRDAPHGPRTIVKVLRYAYATGVFSLRNDAEAGRGRGVSGAGGKQLPAAPDGLRVSSPALGRFRAGLFGVAGDDSGSRLRSRTQYNHGMQRATKSEIAFYYPGPIWRSSDWIKTLILFFDGLGVLLPNYMRGKLEQEDPATAIPLMDKGLLHVLEPEKIVDERATKRLGETMGEIIESGALDTLSKDTRFHEISYSRMGGYGDERIAGDLWKRLKSKGLAKDSEDGVSIPMHPIVRALILVLLSQILRPHGANLGAELSPATDRPDMVQALEELLSLPNTPSAGVFGYRVWAEVSIF